VTRRLRGVPAAPGAALAAPWVYRPVAPADRPTTAIDLDTAAARAADELGALAERLSRAGRGEEAAILEAQQLMATDPELLDAARTRLAAGGPVERAVVEASEEVAATLAALDDPVLSARAVDVRDVGARIARVLRGEAPPRLAARSVAIAGDLPPSVTVELDPSLLAGIALESGSRTAHAAILARALRIPAVVGVEGLLAALDGATSVAVDGGTGEVIVDPGDDEKAAIERAARVTAERRAEEATLHDVPLATRDGHRLQLAANVGSPTEAAAARAAGAEAVGLFRTELTFMGRPSAPDEATQAEAYASVMRAFAPAPVAIRLLDVGGDKALPYLGLPAEANPALGVRAIRLAERDPELLIGQLRAILRAGQEAGSVPWIMAPMVADPGDVRFVKALLERAAAGFDMRPDHRFGVMIEVPSAALLAAEICAEVDFVSIGTNDLTQYLLAADRTNAALAARQDPFHPAVLRAIAATVAGAAQHGTHVAACGEMAGDPAGAVCLVGLGVAELSMDAASFGSVKRAVASVTREEASTAAAAAMEAVDADGARAAIVELLEGRP
jgi:phosphoenolpyruvate-protein phosphotransferase